MAHTTDIGQVNVRLEVGLASLDGTNHDATWTCPISGRLHDYGEECGVNVGISPRCGRRIEILAGRK